MKNINAYSKEELYQIFLNRVDDLSRIRLESIDMTLSIYKMKFTNLGVILTETNCYNKSIYLKRNKMGFYADETVSFESEKAFENYNKSVKFLKENENEFKIIHNLLKDKEAIMGGYYTTTREYETDLEIIVKVLGYGSIRDEELKDENLRHPSEEYEYIISLIERCKNESNYKGVLKEIMSHLETLFGINYQILIKRKRDKYDFIPDSYIGIILIDNTTGSKTLLYGEDQENIYKDDYSKYKVNTKYLEMYLKLATKCIK